MPRRAPAWMRLIWLPLQASLILGLVPTMPRDSRRGGSWGVVAAMLGAPWGGLIGPDR